jgi:hypothetical protein
LMDVSRQITSVIKQWFSCPFFSTAIQQVSDREILD